MIRFYLAALLLLLGPTPAMSQRNGRPYSLAENPQSILEIKTEKEHRYYRISDLHKMHRSTVTLVDPMTNTRHDCEGVALEQLLPSTTLSAQGESIEILFGPDKNLSTAGIVLDSETELIVIDTVDGKTLSGFAPYYLVTKSRNKPEQTIPHVRCITLKSAKASVH